MTYRTGPRLVPAAQLAVLMGALCLTHCGGKSRQQPSNGDPCCAGAGSLPTGGADGADGSEPTGAAADGGSSADGVDRGESAGHAGSDGDASVPSAERLTCSLELPSHTAECLQCEAAAVEGACRSAWLDLGEPECADERGCAIDYCFCDRGCEGNLCECVESCLRQDASACRTRWRSLVECLESLCSSACNP